MKAAAAASAVTVRTLFHRFQATVVIDEMTQNRLDHHRLNVGTPHPKLRSSAVGPYTEGTFDPSRRR
jgi:hypothetical protein